MARRLPRKYGESGLIPASRPIRRAIAPAVLAVAALFAPLHAARPFDAQKYITVLDADRHPVLGLSAEDFAMRDGAVRQPVIDVEPATAPLSIAVVLEGFEAGDRTDVTAALAAMRRPLLAADAGHRLGLLDTVAPGGPSLVDVTTDRARMDAAVAGLIGPAGPAGRPAFIDALLAACQALRSAPTDRRVVVAIARRHPGDGGVSQPTRLTDAIFTGRVALWTIEVGPVQTTALDRAIGDGVDFSGALRGVVPAMPALPTAADDLTNLLLSQYVLTYAWPNPMLSQVSISIRHDRGIVLAPIWTR